jgi:hypothetical protein
VARREHPSLPQSVQAGWAASQVGSQRFRASIPTIRMRRRPAGCLSFCSPPSSDNLEDQNSVGSSIMVRRGVIASALPDFSQLIDGLKKNLTRRANHRHIYIIAKIMQSPGGEIRRGLFV